MKNTATAPGITLRTNLNTSNWVKDLYNQISWFLDDVRDTSLFQSGSDVVVDIQHNPSFTVRRAVSEALSTNLGVVAVKSKSDSTTCVTLRRG